MRFEQPVSGGMSVVVDASNCIEILQAYATDRVDSLTVTNVDLLVATLRAAQRFVASEEGRSGEDGVLLEIEVSAEEAEGLSRWHTFAVDASDRRTLTQVVDVVGLVERLAEAAAS